MSDHIDTIIAAQYDATATPLLPFGEAKKTRRRVNSSVPREERARKQGTQDLIREMLLDGKRFNYLEIMRLTGSPATAQRINELCEQGYVIKRDKSAVGNGVVDYWMEPEDIEVARKVLAEHAKKKAARRQENAA